jgi:hypothetical protein
MSSHLLEAHFNGPSSDKERDDVEGIKRFIGAKPLYLICLPRHETAPSQWAGLVSPSDTSKLCPLPKALSADAVRTILKTRPLARGEWVIVLTGQR